MRLLCLDFAKTRARTTCGAHIVKGCCSTILIAAVHQRLQPGSMRLWLSCASTLASSRLPSTLEFHSYNSTIAPTTIGNRRHYLCRQCGLCLSLKFQL